VDLSTVTGLAGDLLAAAAVVLATVELRKSDRRAQQSRQDLIDGRRLDVQLEQLVALHEDLLMGGRVAPHVVRLRVSLLPAGLLPSADMWIQSANPPVASPLKGEFDRDLAAAMAAGAEGLDWSVWVRDRVRVEIDQAIETLLDGRQPSTAT
jgi:hypothetical protein